ncbi:MAG: DUF6629 family protein [Caulobacteraceae bacterium]
MCFSPTASFSAAAVTGACGAVALSRIRSAREAPLAAIPLAFAAQQALEGALWLALPAAPGESAASPLALAYLAFAQVFWPLWAPLAVLMVEPGRWRRRIAATALAVGAGVAAYLALGLASLPPVAAIVHLHIAYPGHDADPTALVAAYVLATCAPLLASSRRAVVVFGVLVLAGDGASGFFYWEASLSVWCFFAAAASVVLAASFLKAR